MQLLDPSTLVLLSDHARLRMAQRAIPRQVVNVLLDVGNREHDPRGALRVHLRHKAAKRQFAQALGSETASRYRDVYAIITADNKAVHPTLVTVGRVRTTSR